MSMVTTDLRSTKIGKQKINTQQKHKNENKRYKMPHTH